MMIPTPSKTIVTGSDPKNDGFDPKNDGFEMYTYTLYTCPIQVFGSFFPLYHMGLKGTFFFGH